MRYEDDDEGRYEFNARYNDVRERFAEGICDGEAIEFPVVQPAPVFDASPIDTDDCPF